MEGIPRVASGAICVPQISLPGCTGKAIPLGRWMAPSYTAMSPGSRETVPATSQKRPKASAISSDSSNDKVC
jgi:hypothetical protein